MESKYDTLRTEELKAELKKRNAKLSGRKRELIERLQAYDRNSNFGQAEILSEKEYTMMCPDPLIYKDLNSDKKIPCVNIEGIEHYLNKFEKSMDTTPVGLYREKHLCYLRVCYDGDLCYLKSACRAEMKKSITYHIDICLTGNSEIEEAQCECAAGMGPSAHCKHVCTVLYAAHVFCKTGSVLVENTCTEKLQSFHHVKKPKGSPVKMRDLHMDGADEATNVDFDPRPQKFRKMPNYSDFFRNTCLNFKGVSKMPIFQLFEPANVRGYVHDHDYLEKTQEDLYLESVGLLNISLEKAKGIELRTQGQTKNKLWHEHRSMRITSSHFGRICKATERTDLNKLADELLNPKPFHAKATNHGIKYETEAVRKYEEKLQCKVNQCGLFVSHDFPYLGASPDGITSSGVLLEVKCPYKACGMEITNKTVPYMKKRDSVLLLDESHNYYYQVQGQLFCTGAQFCDFFVYSIADSKVLRIQPDDEFISSMVAKLQTFYRKFFEPKLLNKHFYNDYRA